MAMMISKFHKMIQSKVVWYIVLGVIVISFVGFFTPTLGSRASAQRSLTMGTLFGEKISRDRYRTAFQNTQTWYILSTGRMPGSDSSSQAALREQAWLRLAMLHKAAEQKIAVSNSEVIEQIQQMPFFRGQSGAFDPALYRGVVGQLGLSPRQLESVVREQISMRKLMAYPMQAALATPSELERAYRTYTDRLIFEYAVLPREAVAPSVSVSRAEAKAFFEDHVERFRMPAKVRVSYVDYPVADFVAQADVPEGAALKLYNQNLERYRIESTNETAEVSYRPFDAVEAEIVAELKKEAARRMAIEQATSLVAEIAPKGPNAKPTFDSAVAAAGLTAKSLPAFGPQDLLRAIDATAPFQRTALALKADAYSSFSDAVVGEESVYVISLDQRYESFLPTFDAVEEKAMEAAREQAVSEALTERAKEIQDTLTAVLESGTNFKEAVKPLQFPVETTEEFDFSNPLQHPYANQILTVGIDAKQGALCEPTAVPSGILFAYVAQRKAAETDLSESEIRDQLVDGMTRLYEQRLVASWQAALMKEANLSLNQ